MTKKFIKKFIPKIILKLREKVLNKRTRNKFSKMGNKEIFKEIYLKKLWSPEFKKSQYKFYSGVGSYFPELVNEYLDKIENFLHSLGYKPNIVDLGCGDFVIGSKIRKFCKNYIAIDIFDELISYNKKRYKNLNIDFRVLDITQDELPNGDVCFVRQVFQHMSNEEIMNTINEIKKKYKYLVITEHLAESKNFVANLDKPTGPDTRLYENSGVILTLPPFNLKVFKDTDICEIYSDSIEGVLSTKILQLYK